MTITIEDGVTVMRADEGKVFRRTRDGFVMGDTIYLGMDYSTGIARQDLPEYYEEIEVAE